jgi:hypothetical protein
MCQPGHTSGRDKELSVSFKALGRGEPESIETYWQARLMAKKLRTGIDLFHIYQDPRAEEDLVEC